MNGRNHVTDCVCVWSSRSSIHTVAVAGFLFVTLCAPAMGNKKKPKQQQSPVAADVTAPKLSASASDGLALKACDESLGATGCRAVLHWESLRRS